LSFYKNFKGEKHMKVSFGKYFSKALPVTVILISMFTSVLVYSAEYIEGEHYRVVDKPGIPATPGKIEVREFFWYGCPHCFSLEGKLTPWKKTLASDVNFVATPAVAAAHWKVLGSAYLAAENLGISEKSHSAVFNAIHRDRQILNSPQQVATFYTKFGVTEQDFLDQMNSFSTKTALRKAESLFRQYQLTGVPAIIVNGKYQPISRSYDEMLRIIDFLIDKERKEMLNPTSTK
jgi:thiol:disulfide interchange protein DsbA